MSVLQRYAICLALISSFRVQSVLALDSVDPDIGEIILPAWDYTVSLEEIFVLLSAYFLSL